MGKAKNNKFGQSGAGDKKDAKPYGKAGSAAKGGADPERNSLLDDLGSLDESRRENACRLIADIFTGSNVRSFERVALKPVLAALIMRLVDASMAVRVHAARAVRNMSCSCSTVVVQGIVDAGVIRTALGLISSLCASGVLLQSATATDAVDSAAMEAPREVAEQLLASVAALLGTCDDAYDDVVGYADIVPMLLRLTAAGCSAGVRREAANVLSTATEGNSDCCSAVAAAGGLEPLGSVFARGAEAAAELSPSDASAVVACAGVFVNMYSWAPDEAMQQRCALPTVLQHLLRFSALSTATREQLCRASETVPTAASAGEEEDEARARAAREEKEAAAAALIQALSVVKSAAEVAANVAIMLNSEHESGSRGTSTHGQLVHFCQSNNVFGAYGGAVQEHFDILASLTGRVAAGEITISTSSMALVDNLDRLMTVLLNMSESSSALLSGNLGLLPNFVRIADHLLMCVQNTISTKDAEGRRNTVWAVDNDEVGSTQAMKAFASCASTALGLVASVLRNAEFSPDDIFLKSVVALVCRGLGMPNYDVASVSIEVASILGVKSAPLNAVLSNAILRKMEAPRVFKSRADADGSFVNTDATALMLGVCVDAIIDMHSSDDSALLQNFIKLNAGSKIESALHIIAAKLQDSTGELDELEQQHLAEIIDNAQGFLAYKHQSIVNK